MAVPAQLQSLEHTLRGSLASAQRWYAALPKEKVHKVLVWALALWIVFGIAKLVYSLLPQSDVAPPPATVMLGSGPSAPGAESYALDPKAVEAWELFGPAGAVPVAQPVQRSNLNDDEADAEETRLQLTLNGIIESDQEENSRAIITYQGKQDHYILGDKLPVNGQVTLHRLLPDRALLKNSGKIEALYLFDPERNATASRAAPRPVARQPVRAAQQASLATGMRQKLLDNPMSITDVVRISEARENGTLIGYKVRPSKDKDQFEKLGLQTNDVVLAVNGVALDNVSNAMRVFQTLRTETEASFDISRSGENISLVVSLDDVTDEESE